MKQKSILLLILFFLISAALIIYKSRILNVNHIELEIDKASCTNQKDLLNIYNLEGDPILFIDKKKLLKISQEKFPCIKSITSEIIFPNNLKIKVSGREGFVKLSAYPSSSHLDLDSFESSPSSAAADLDWTFISSSSAFLTGKEGFIFANYQNEDLPLLLINDQNLKIGYQLDKIIFEKIAVIFEKLTSLNILGTAKLENSNLLIGGSQKLIFSLKKDVSVQLTSLQLIMAKAKIDGRMLESTDLRFDKPVIVYIPKR